MAKDTISCRCARCGCKFRVSQRYAGRKAHCPNQQCDATFVIPADLGSKSQKSQPPRQPVSNAPNAARDSSAKDRLPPAVAPVRPQKAFPRRWQGAALIAAACVAAAFVARGTAQSVPKPLSLDQPVIPVSVEPPRPSFQEALEPYLVANCLDCHSGDSPEGDLNLALDKNTEDVQANRARWEKAYDMIRIGAMPPPDFSTPSEDETQAIVAWLDDTLFHVDCNADADPGRVTVRRLNRTEYTNTVRDLFGVDFDPAEAFPSDDVGYGFDNIGDVLTVPPLLLEKYLDAAEAISQRAILTGDPDAETVVQDGAKLKSDGGAHPDRGNGRLTMAASGGTARLRDVNFPRDGQYIIRVEAGGNQAGDEPVRLEVKVGGKSLGEIDVKEDADSPKLYELQHEFKAGIATVDVTFVNDYYKKGEGDRNAYVYSVGVYGPLGIDTTNLPPAHSALTKVRLGEGKSVADAAAANLRPLVRRAFRRTVTDAEVAPFVRFVELATERGDSFEAAMQVAVQAVLVSPQFLFRIENESGNKNAPTKSGGIARRLNGFELATRLSYFIWNTTPDDRLLDLAESGELLRDDILDREVKRMLGDVRADQMVDNFAGQWLGLRKLGEMSPDTDIFQSFDAKLRTAMERETYEFVRYVFRSQQPITELLTARYSFLNEQLAKHYGIDGVAGDNFRRVEHNGNQRAGLLTQASILMLTSYPNRTSPVRRGEWVLANILGDEPPPAPPNVPTLEETQAEAKDLSLREQMAKHREDPSCAACHKTMDAIGFGFENYDAIGRWRDKDGQHNVDSGGELPSGEKFSGAIDLVQILAGREQEFVETLSERLLTFALGRGIEYTDKCTLDQVVEEAGRSGNTFNAIVTAIVHSDAFRYQGIVPRSDRSVAAVEVSR